MILACFKHMLDPYVEGTQPPLLAMKPRFHHAMPAVGDAVVVQGLPACQGFNGRRSRRGSSGAEAVAWWAYPPGYFMNLGHVFFFWSFEGDYDYEPSDFNFGVYDVTMSFYCPCGLLFK